MNGPRKAVWTATLPPRKIARQHRPDISPANSASARHCRAHRRCGRGFGVLVGAAVAQESATRTRSRGRFGPFPFVPPSHTPCKARRAHASWGSIPEPPDIAAYIAALEPRVMGLPLERVRLVSPSLLRTTAPAPSEAAGRTVRQLWRVGNRIAIGLDGALWPLLHLMIAGRLHWKPAHAALSGRRNLAPFDFPPGSLTLTDAGAKRRASLHVVAGAPGLLAIDPGGIDVLTADPAGFRAALIRENRTPKRALTDPASSAASGTRTRTRSSTPPGSRPSLCPAS